MKEVDIGIVITAIICITLIEIMALSQGMNGVLLSAVIAIIAGLAGFVIPSPIKLRR